MNVASRLALILLFACGDPMTTPDGGPVVSFDSGVDAPPSDAQPDAGSDAGIDAGPEDAGPGTIVPVVGIHTEQDGEDLVVRLVQRAGDEVTELAERRWAPGRVIDGQPTWFNLTPSGRSATLFVTGDVARGMPSVARIRWIDLDAPGAPLEIPWDDCAELRAIFPLSEQVVAFGCAAPDLSWHRTLVMHVDDGLAARHECELLAGSSHFERALVSCDEGYRLLDPSGAVAADFGPLSDHASIRSARVGGADAMLGFSGDRIVRVRVDGSAETSPGRWPRDASFLALDPGATWAAIGHGAPGSMQTHLVPIAEDDVRDPVNHCPPAGRAEPRVYIGPGAAHALVVCAWETHLVELASGERTSVPYVFEHWTPWPVFTPDGAQVLLQGNSNPEVGPVLFDLASGEMQDAWPLPAEEAPDWTFLREPARY